MSIAPAMRDELDREGFDFVSLIKEGCLPIAGTYRAEIDSRYDCPAFTDKVFDLARSYDARAVILSARWTLHLGYGRYTSVLGGRELGEPIVNHVAGLSEAEPQTPDALLRHSAAFLEELSAKVPVLMIGQIPGVGSDARKLARFSPEKLAYPYDAYVLRNGADHLAMASAAGKAARLQFYDPSETLCPAATPRLCLQAINQTLLYTDNNHLNGAGARLLATGVVRSLLNFSSMTTARADPLPATTVPQRAR